MANHYRRQNHQLPAVNSHFLPRSGVPLYEHHVPRGPQPAVHHPGGFCFANIVELRKRKLLDVMQMLEEDEEDINQIMNYFKHKHYCVIYLGVIFSLHEANLSSCVPCGLRRGNPDADDVIYGLCVHLARGQYAA